jgi:hypothetical protein
MRRRPIVVSILLALLLPGAALPAAQPANPGAAASRPATRPVTRPAAGAFEVYEWAVFVCDPAQPELNAAGLYPSALPEFIADKRANVPAAVAATQPSPVGVIRFTGPPPSDGGKVDALLEVKAGRFLTHWPRSKSRPNRLLWDNLELLAEPAGLEEVKGEHWYAALRRGESTYLRRLRRAERFLLYDVEINHPNPLRLEGGAGFKYQVSNAGAAPLHDVQIYKPVDGGWRVGGLAQLAVSKGGTGPTTAPAARPGPATGPTTRPASGPTTGPTTAPAGVEVTLGDTPVSKAADAVAPWKDRLAAAGLPATDFAVIGSVLEKHALESKRLTVVYRLDPAEMERLLPLELTPSPRKLVRVGLVVIRNLDPGIGEDVDRLIAQLGDEEWAKREAASKQLAEIGPAAKGKLEAATKHKDLEIAWRAERLIQVLSPAPAPQPR